MKSLKSKIMITSMLLTLIAIFTCTGISIYTISKQSKESISIISRLLNKDYDNLIKSQVKNALSIIEEMDKKYKNQGKNLSERKYLIKEFLRNVRYAKDGYFWIYKSDVTNVLSPMSPKSEGKNFFGKKDAKGNMSFKQRIDNGLKEGGGYTDYWFPRKGGTKAVHKRSFTMSYSPFDWIIGTGNFVDDIEKKLASLQEEAQKNTEKFLFIFSVFTLVAIIVVIILISILSKYISQPVETTSLFIKKIATGDLTSNIDKKLAEKEDEVGIMVSSSNALKEKLMEIIGEIQKIAFDLAASSEETAATSKNFSSGTQSQAGSLTEISSTIEEIRAGVESIHESTADQLKSMEDLTEGISFLKNVEARIKNNVQFLADKSENISNKASEGNSLLQTMQSRFNEISESSNQMLNIVKVITDVADKINLLSLNAAIESARAGEAGRGFAVVADEISQLADETQTNVKSIQQNIMTNNQKIEQGEEIIKDSMEKITVIMQGVIDVADSVKSVDEEIDAQAGQSNKLENNISVVQKKSEIIQQGISEINIAMGEISIAVNTIDDTVQIAASGSEELAESADQIAKMSQRVQKKLEFFQI